MSTTQTFDAPRVSGTAGIRPPMHKTSNTGLSLLKKCPEDYWSKYIAKTLETKTTWDMAFGSAVETTLLSDTKEAHKYLFGVGGEPFERRSKSGKGRDTIWKFNASDRELWQSICEGSRLSPAAAAYLQAPGEIQKWCEREVPGMGIKLRGKIDKWIPETNTIVEIKTSKASRGGGFDPEDWARSAWDLGYFRQAHIYTTFMQALTGWLVPIDFVWLVFPKASPFVPAVLRPGPDSMSLAHEECDRLLGDLYRRLQSGDWKSSYRKQPMIIDAPRWAS